MSRTAELFTFAALSTIIMYLILGGLTYNATRDNLARACQPAPDARAHMLLWPMSYGLSVGLRSHC